MSQYVRLYLFYLSESQFWPDNLNLPVAISIQLRIGEFPTLPTFHRFTMNIFAIRNVQADKIMNIRVQVGPPGAKCIIRSMLSLSLTYKLWTWSHYLPLRSLSSRAGALIFFIAIASWSFKLNLYHSGTSNGLPMGSPFVRYTTTATLVLLAHHRPERPWLLRTHRLSGISAKMGPILIRIGRFPSHSHSCLRKAYVYWIPGYLYHSQTSTAVWLTWLIGLR